MNITIDEMEYDKFQHQLVRELAKTIKFELEQAGLTEEQVYNAVDGLTFSITAILDGSRVIEVRGQPLIPMVTFALDAERKSLVAPRTASWMHEYASGDVEELFSNDRT